MNAITLGEQLEISDCGNWELIEGVEMKQMSFGFLRDYKKEFGGSLLAGKRKTQRPLSIKAPIHLILKADQKGIFNPSNRSLDKLIRKTAGQFHVQFLILPSIGHIFIF